MINKNHNEKRRYIRVDTNIPVIYHSVGNELPNDTKSTASNLSEGGIKFITECFVARSSRLVMNLEMPEKIPPVSAISKVAWIKKTTEGQYEIGGHFVEISKKDKAKIANFVENLAKMRPPK